MKISEYFNVTSDEVTEIFNDDYDVEELDEFDLNVCRNEWGLWKNEVYDVDLINDINQTLKKVNNLGDITYIS